MNMNETMTKTKLNKIEALQESQKNIKITIGTIMGFILLVFFFTFALLVDKFPPVFFIIETIITIIIIPAFFMLNKISFFILKLKKGKKEEYRDIIGQLNANDVDKKAAVILGNIQQ